MFFKNEYSFLSNFYPCLIPCELGTFRNVEAAFQAHKCPLRAREFINLSGAEAKRLGRSVALRPDWEDIKLSTMKTLLITKFAEPGLQQKLLEISEPIAEDNYWHDTYWGICNGIGENHLGKLLMEVRDFYKQLNEGEQDK